MKFIVVACLVAVCAAAKAPPTIPTLPETFSASGEIEFHLAEETRFGKFFIGRDQANMKGLEASDFEETNEIEAALLRYDMKPDPMAFYIRGKMDDLHCSPDKRNGTAGGMPPFWAWLPLATYEGERPYRHGMLNFWGYSVGDVRFEVAFPINTNLPAYYNRKEAEDFINYTFMTFNSTAPDPNMFELPKACQDVKGAL